MPAPYPAFNLINGNWIRDTRQLLTEEGRRRVARPPLERRAYFLDAPYDRGWREFNAMSSRRSP